MEGIIVCIFFYLHVAKVVTSPIAKIAAFILYTTWFLLEVGKSESGDRDEKYKVIRVTYIVISILIVSYFYYSFR